MEIVELRDHPWFVASQFHPEFKSRPDRPHPLFAGFIAAAVAHGGQMANRARPRRQASRHPCMCTQRAELPDVVGCGALGSCAPSAVGRAVLHESATRSYRETMRTVDLKVLKDRLSEYVRIAASGETILVTDRNRVVAELVPPREGRNVVAQDAMLAEAVRRGWLTPALGSSGGPVPRRRVTTLDGLLAEMAGDRADR